MTLTRGTQIVYIPTHCNDDIEHPDVEFGFVTSVRNDVAFCRYWSKHHKGELRTKANSEATPLDLVFKHISTSQTQVIRELNNITTLHNTWS